MNTAARIAAAAVAAILSVGPAVADTSAPSTLLWDCAHTGAPSLGQVKQLFDEANNHYASLLRARLQMRLRMRLRAECQRGAGQVLFAVERPAQGNPVFVARTVPNPGL